MGWCVAPPTSLAADGRWLAVAYNVRGCLEFPSYVVEINDAQTEAIAMLGVNFELYTDADCVRAQHRRLN